MPDDWWLVWSVEDESWLRPGGCGYTTDDRRAGRHTETQARRECNGRPHRVMVLAPESWPTTPTDTRLADALNALVRTATREDART